MKINKLRSLSMDDLNEKLIVLFREKFNLKMQLSSRKLKKCHLLKIVKKKIAVIKTILSENGNRRNE